MTKMPDTIEELQKKLDYTRRIYYACSKIPGWEINSFGSEVQRAHRDALERLTLEGKKLKRQLESLPRGSD